MAARHKHHKKAGGATTGEHEDPPVKEVDNSKESESYKLLQEKKRGGRAKHKAGGKVMHAEGGKAKHHMGKPGRKRGGGVGADKTPLSSAAHVTAAHEKRGGKC